MDFLFDTTIGETVLSFGSAVVITLTSLVLGLVISGAYIFTHKKEGYTPSFTVTLVIMPVIVAVIIFMVGSNVARAFSLAGAFSLIRFRSAPGDPKDIMYVFFTVAIGLVCGMGHIEYAFLFTAIICIAMIALTKTSFANPKTSPMILKITIPENLNYDGVFDGILNQYTKNWHLKRVRTSDFGAVFELVYQVEMKNDHNQKEFIDDIRCKNGNLNISLIRKEFADKIYA